MVDFAALPAKDSIASIKPAPRDADLRISWRAAAETSVGGHGKGRLGGLARV